MLRIERTPQPDWMDFDDFRALRDELFEFHGKGGVRKLQTRFPLAESLAPFVLRLETSLGDQFAQRCAYSEVRGEDVEKPLRLVWHRPTNDAAQLDGTIDHDHYWWLTLDWSNWYLGSAFIESVKSYQFPVVGARSPVGAVEPFGSGDAIDNGLLLDPCVDEPAWWLRFRGDGSVGSRLHPSEEEMERFEYVDRGEVTIRILDLDNDSLRGQRHTAQRELSSSAVWGQPDGAVVEEILDGRRPHRAALLQFAVTKAFGQESGAIDQSTMVSLVERAPEVLGAHLFDPGTDARALLAGADKTILDDLGDRLITEFPDLEQHPRFGQIFRVQRVPPLQEPVRDRRQQRDEPAVSIGPTDRIRRVLIKDFRAIRQVELTIESELVSLPPTGEEVGSVGNPTPVTSTQWKVLLGENGSGKSSILHAIALALTGDRLEEFMAAAGLRWGSILRRTDDPDERVQGRVLIEFTGGQRIDLRFTDSTAWFHGLGGRAPAMHVNVRAYGATRLLQKSRNRHAEVPELLADLAASVETANEATGDRERCLDAVNEASLLIAEVKDRLTVPARTTSTTTIDIGNLLDSSVPVIDAMRWLRELGDDDFNVAALTLADLLGEPSTVVPGGGSAPSSAERRRIARKGRGESVTIFIDDDPLDVVSDGYRSVIAVACDIMQAVGGLDIEGGGYSDISQARGIVMIDEIGAHLHPRWRMQITDRLRRSFPNVQFLTTTHEPLCLRGLQENEVVRVSKWENHGVVLQEIERAPARYRVDQLLTSEFFGLDSAIDPEVDAKFKRYYELRRRLGPDDPVGPELRMLDAELNQRLRPVLGYTRRDQMMYEAIDDFLATEDEIEDPDERHRRRVAAVQAVAEQWNKLRRVPR